MKKLDWICIWTAAVLLLVLLLEAESIQPRYEPRQATIVSVQDDSSWGYVGEDKRTLVQWADGIREYCPGALGEQGESIMARRQCGTVSLFGLFGDMSYWRHKKGKVV